VISDKLHRFRKKVIELISKQGKNMDIFHIKVFKKPKKIFSVLYSIESNLPDSHFIKVDDCLNFLDRPGMNPSWLDKVLEIQKDDLALARKYVFNKIKKANQLPNYQISIGFDWDVSNFQYDKFINNVITLVNN
jgi:hypothetical protein